MVLLTSALIDLFLYSELERTNSEGDDTVDNTLKYYVTFEIGKDIAQKIL